MDTPKAAEDSIRQPRFLEKVCPLGEGWTEWGFYEEPDNPEGPLPSTPGRRKKAKGRWIALGRRRLTQDGDLEIVFLD
ncbi:MAG: hypothetical protein WDN46_07710 [Methylocella sp.]